MEIFNKKVKAVLTEVVFFEDDTLVILKEIKNVLDQKTYDNLLKLQNKHVKNNNHINEYINNN